MIPSFHRATGQESTLGASFAYSAPEHVGAHTTKPAPTAVRRAPNERDPGRDGNGGQPTGTPRALPGSSTRRQFHTLGAGTCRSPHHETGAEKAPPNPQQCATQAAMETTANRTALRALPGSSTRELRTPERDAHRPSYERPNGSSPAGRGAAGPYPTTLARSAAENSAGCSITLGAAIR